MSEDRQKVEELMQEVKSTFIFSLLGKIAEFIREKGKVHYSEVALKFGKSPSWVSQWAPTICSIYSDIEYQRGTFYVKGKEAKE